MIFRFRSGSVDAREGARRRGPRRRRPSPGGRGAGRSRARAAPRSSGGAPCRRRRPGTAPRAPRGSGRPRPSSRRRPRARRERPFRHRLAEPRDRPRRGSPPSSRSASRRRRRRESSRASRRRARSDGPRGVPGCRRDPAPGSSNAATGAFSVVAVDGEARRGRLHVVAVAHPDGLARAEAAEEPAPGHVHDGPAVLPPGGPAHLSAEPLGDPHHPVAETENGHPEVEELPVARAAPPRRRRSTVRRRG